MHINQAAKQLNTTPRTIRFYEEKELVSPQKDAKNDYRTFTDHDLLRLSTILALREIGMQIDTIKGVLDNPDMSMNDYLNVQRSALFEKWIEMKDMIHTIDQMIEKTTEDDSPTDTIVALAKHLKNMKNLRKSWEDKWHFDDQAAGYDQNIKMAGYRFNVHQDYDKALSKAAETTNLQPNDVCVDIGVGTGNLGAKFFDKGARIIGIDQSEEMLKVCAEKYPAIETRKGHFLALPLLDNQADAIVSSYALHHIPDDEKLLALDEMNRVLKTNGQVCVVDLMFNDTQHRTDIMRYFGENGNLEAIDAIEDEFYADRSKLTEWLATNGYHVETYQFNTTLSMIYARR
ncbi:putative AdoMet-dependent methyltransferase [Lentibacillus halodurans]|uniref:Putative AdoMet-dependent methyltransferase n=1 Tax=Lentibacillus halodurans TaxID=237679 RepID=A0A1I0X879_9BACI|nr:methyltransferase domain-containing protein [Lentibacillus halodurans]SFA96203.1 putative AdoMet-dependent methyltransferase [Lentibacillus halodurans]